MQDNVRAGQSLTKKISFHDKHPRPQRSGDVLDKAPTRKKITITNEPMSIFSIILEKDSHPLIGHKQPDRKTKSLGRNEGKKYS